MKKREPFIPNNREAVFADTAVNIEKRIVTDKLEGRHFTAKMQVTDSGLHWKYRTFWILMESNA